MVFTVPMTNTERVTRNGSSHQRRTNLEDGMRALYEAKDLLAAARNAFASLGSDDPARWLNDECYARWLNLRRLLIEIEDGKVPS